MTQILIKFFLINTYLPDSNLTKTNFIIYLLALITIVAGGYIINDIYDVEIDKINKPDKIIIDKKISKNLAVKLYFMLNLTGVVCGFYSAYQVKKLWFGFIFFFFTYSLWMYSKKYKTSFLIGNLQVSFLTALSIINLAIFDLIPNGLLNNEGSIMVFNIILYYAGFSFIITLIRELIKDLEDNDGDKKNGANTLAINYGMEKTKIIIILLVLITSTAIGYFQYFQYSILSTIFSVDLNYWGVNLISVLYVLILQLLMILLLIKILKSNSKYDFYILSRICKIIMLCGIFSIPLFFLTHQAQ